MHLTPTQRAERLLKDYCINSASELNLEELANSEYLIVEEEDLSNHLGRISFSSEYGLIKIDSKIKDVGQKRFTLAHEMGHYFNEKLKIQNSKFWGILNFRENGNTLLSSEGREGDANTFAAELLMHKPWFSEFIKNKKINFELIKDIASEFNVSLTAAAIRYANIGKYPAAVIMSKEGYVSWSYKSDYFPFKWIPKGYKVRRESAAYDFFAGNEMQTCEDLIPAYVWFAEDSKCREDVYLHEQNVAMPNYHSVLTLLWESEFK